MTGPLRRSAWTAPTRPLVVTLALVAACTLAFSVDRALAVFTGGTSVPGNGFSTGMIALGTSPATALLTVSNMIPGDSTTGAVTVTNTGGSPVRYAVTSTTTENVLAGLLQLSIKTGVSDCSQTGFANTGTVVAGPVTFGATTGVAVLGSTAQGQQAGDRTLATGASEVLCFRVVFPLSTATTGQGVTTTATFTFDAEQTVNNP